MPLIGPPIKKEPIIQYDEIKSCDWIKVLEYLNIQNWICPICGSTVFGRTLFCPFNFNKGPQCLTPKPKSII